MIGKTISHYRGSSRIRLSPDKILEKLGEGGIPSKSKRDKLCPAGKEGNCL